jgi:hypothetical protein
MVFTQPGSEIALHQPVAPIEALCWPMGRRVPLRDHLTMQRGGRATLKQRIGGIDSDSAATCQKWSFLLPGAVAAKMPEASGSVAQPLQSSASAAPCLSAITGSRWPPNP